MKSSKQAMNTIEIANMWNRYQSDYSKFLSKNLLTIHLSLFNLSKVDLLDRPKILDAGCGSGYGIKIIRELLNKSHIIYGCDISSNMINYSNSHLKRFTESDVIELNMANQLKSKILNIDDDDKLIDSKAKNSIVRLYEMNNEDLKFKDKSFDTVFSNFTLNIVNNPQKMVDESFRVLKANGSACFSIWGRPEYSLPFTVVPKALRKNNIALPDIRSFFHLSNEKYIKPLFSNFRNLYIGYSRVNLNMFSFDDFEFMIRSPIYEDIFETIQDQELKTKIINEIKKDIDHSLKDNNFLHTEVIIIKAIK